MIKSITVTNYLGESRKFPLTDPKETGCIITNIDGISTAKASVYSTNVATSDVSIYNYAQLSSRNIVVNFKFLALPTIEDVRLSTYQYFPVKKQVKLLFETDNRVCYAIGYVESNEADIFSKDERCQISIICPDPYFYSEENHFTVFSGVQGAFRFPFSNESLTEKLLQMGQIRYQTEEVVPYFGDAEVGIVMKIHAIGTVKNFKIYNIKTREVMSIDTDKLAALTGTGFVYGDEIIISTVVGDKYIKLLRNGEYTNILNILDRDADWFQLARGENVFAYVAEDGTENIQFRIEHRVIYEGI